MMFIDRKSSSFCAATVQAHVCVSVDDVTDGHEPSECMLVEGETHLCLGTGSLEGLLGAVLGVALVAHKLGVHTAQRRVLVGLGLLDTVAVSLAHLVVLRRVL